MDSIKVLVVDDESRMRKLVKDFLSKKGYYRIDGEAQNGSFYFLYLSMFP